MYDKSNYFAPRYKCIAQKLDFIDSLGTYRVVSSNTIFDLISACALTKYGAQWLSGRVLDSRPKGRGFEPHGRHCFVVLEQDTFILA